ncbi:hypothetical protein EJ110_NYTH41782 [Nymphaea thermarum]|nr:hypothetical protein EJ110_NYTH41782 [Nymphaea thermarum]
MQDFPWWFMSCQAERTNFTGHRTRSRDFLGLTPGTANSLLSDANYGEEAVIGVIDADHT